MKLKTYTSARYLPKIPSVAERMTCEMAGLYLDYSKNRITHETIRLLLQLAAECDLRGKIHAMFRGDKIGNITENRAVLHTARRAPRGRDGSWWTGPTLCPRFTPCWIGWPPSATRCEVGPGWGIPASASATW